MTRVPRILLVTLPVFVSLFASACGSGEKNPFNVDSEVVTAADNASALVFAPDGRLFFAEQLTGNIRIVSPDGKLQAEPFANVNTQISLEWGLTGLTLDPAFQQNHYVYAYYTEPRQKDPLIGRPVVMRFTEANGRGVDPQVLIDDLPDTGVHHEGINANGRIHFGPDGLLYISLGDYNVEFDNPNRPSQNLSTPVGKLLRVRSNGSAAPGNPFLDRPDADARVYAYGFREQFDFAFQPVTKKLWGSDNTPVSCEEINIIEAGANYGWPNVGTFPFADCTAGDGVDGIYFLSKPDTRPEDFLSPVVVTGMGFVSASVYPTIGDSLVVCEQQTSLLRRLSLAAPEFQQVTANDVVVKDCKLGIAISSDGKIYYSNEREIRRLIPRPVETK